MKEQFEQIREQIHEICNFLGPLDIKLETLDQQITKSRISFEMKAAQLESKVAEHSSEIALHSEQIRQIQIFLKMPVSPATPIHGDKQNPVGKPPMNPPQ